MTSLAYHMLLLVYIGVNYCVDVNCYSLQIKMTQYQMTMLMYVMLLCCCAGVIIVSGAPVSNIFDDDLECKYQ